MRVAVGSDHAGYELKCRVVEWLAERETPCLDLGPPAFDPTDDYPDFAAAVARAVANQDCDLGIVVCATGIGSCIAANKVAGVRAAVCSETYSARYSRLHNDANVLCLGSRVVGIGLALEIIEAWLNASFSGDKRHARRVAKIGELEDPGMAER
jgi:ribose 5-phosphate isomerase B